MTSRGGGSASSVKSTKGVAEARFMTVGADDPEFSAGSEESISRNASKSIVVSGDVFGGYDCCRILVMSMAWPLADAEVDADAS